MLYRTQLNTQIIILHSTRMININIFSWNVILVLYACVCARLCTHESVYVCVSVGVRVYILMCMRMFAHMSTMYECTHLCICVSECVYISAMVGSMHAFMRASCQALRQSMIQLEIIECLSVGLLQFCSSPAGGDIHFSH